MSLNYRRNSSLDIEDMNQPLTCRLCDGHKNIQWRCVECKIKICTKCKIIHANARISIDHTILSFNDADCCVLDMQLKNRIKKLTCKKHPHSTYAFYCKTCNYLVCTSCNSQSHVIHDICGIDQFINENIRTDGIEVSDNLPRGFLARSPCEDEKNFIGADFHEVSPCEVENNFIGADFHEVSLCEVENNFIGADFHVVHSITVNMADIHFLKTVSTSSAWIGSKESNEIQKIKLPLKSRRQFLKFLYKVMKKDIECTPIDQIEGLEALDIAPIDDDILCVSYLDHNLKRAFTDAYGQKQILNIHNFNPLDPICIHIERGEGSKLIWIGLMERGKEVLIPTSIRKVIAISEIWRIEKTFEFTTTGKRMFTLPFRINNIDDKIFVLDKTSKKTGRVLVLNSLGHRMWEYQDPQDTSTYAKPFIPTAIATSENNKIVVVDAANSAIHVLNIAGNVIVRKSLLELSIYRPFSLDIDNTGQFWIGSKSDKTADEKRAKIYVINMTML